MTQRVIVWHAEDIKAELRKRFGTLRALSRTLGLNHATVSQTIRKPGNSRNVEIRIARALDVPVHEIWPERWSASGPIKQPRRSRKGAA